jgi:hypothetical protein
MKMHQELLPLAAKRKLEKDEQKLQQQHQEVVQNLKEFKT